MDKYVSEQELNEKAVAPRVTLELLEANIAAEYYTNGADAMGLDVPIHESLRLITYCVLVLQNGFTVTGQSACASPENYDAEIGQRVARGDAIRQVWALMGYELRSQLAKSTKSAGFNEGVARMTHEANRVFCAYLGDDSQTSWDEAPDWQKKSAINGVKFHRENPDANASASHDSWMREKVADGWVYGPTKLPDLKQHPCILPFEELPTDQQFKDVLFRTLVHAALAGN